MEATIIDIRDRLAARSRLSLPPLNGAALVRVIRGQLGLTIEGFAAALSEQIGWEVWPGHIKAWESGRARVIREVTEACRRLAEPAMPSDGTVNIPHSTMADIDGQFLALAGAATTGALGSDALASLVGWSQDPSTPARIGHVDARDLQHVIDGMERADHAAGGHTVVRSLALGQLGWAQETLRTASFPSPSTRTAWMTAVSRLGRLAGFMSVDARDHATARRCFLIALQIAADAEDWPSRLNVLSGMARQAVHLDDGVAALKISALARAGEVAASATTRAMMWVLEARAYGVLGRTDDAVTAVKQAEELFARRQTEDDPPWLWFYDEAQLLGDTGHALFPLALANDPVDALRRLRAAVDKHSAADTRGRTFSLIKLATIEVHSNPAPETYRTAREAIAATAQLRSGRALDYLGDLGRVLHRTDTDEAHDLASEASRTLDAIRLA